jgi:hypothetical protein
MYDVVVSTCSTGRVRRRRFPSRSAAEAWARRAESIALRFRLGLRGIRVEFVRVAA